MWNRAELKARGKAAFKKNYWICVLVSLILALIGGSSSSSTSNAASDDSGYYSEYSYDSFDINDLTSGNYDIADLAVSMVTTAFAVITIFLAIIMIVLGIFIFNPLEIGGIENVMVDKYQLFLDGNEYVVIYICPYGHSSSYVPKGLKLNQ